MTKKYVKIQQMQRAQPQQCYLPLASRWWKNGGKIYCMDALIIDMVPTCRGNEFQAFFLEFLLFWVDICGCNNFWKFLKIFMRVISL